MAEHEGLSLYEIERLQNIKRNHDVLASLGLEKLQPKAPAPAKRSKPKMARPPAAPTRSSGRIAALLERSSMRKLI